MLDLEREIEDLLKRQRIIRQNNFYKIIIQHREGEKYADRFSKAEA